MTIQQCKYILKIKETGTFSEAARQLFVATSGLSTSVKLLEDELKIKIFERSKNGVSLTVEGAEFVRYAEELVAQSDFILNRYETETERERLYISTQHYDFIADVFSRFVSDCNSECYDISLEEKKTHEVIHDVETARSDIGIIAIKNSDIDVMMRFLQTKGVDFVQIITTPPHLFVKSTHPLAALDSISYNDAKDYPYVSYDQGEYNSFSLFTEEIADKVIGGKRIVISDRATLMNMLLKTDCYTIGTGIMPSELNDGKIVGIPVVDDELYAVGYIAKKDKVYSKMAEQFITLLCAYSANLLTSRKL